MAYLSLFFAVVLSFVTPATAATGVGGEITTTTWTKASGPYYVLNAITVPAGNTLTIEPGVDVIFEADVQFIVQGRLHAVGTEADSIRFIKGSAAQWGGLTLSEGDTSTLGYARISYVSGARAGLNVTASTRVGMANIKISGNNGGRGLSISGARATLMQCTISTNKVDGLEIKSSSSVTLMECVISGNGGGGLVVWDNATATLTNCTISGNSGSYRGGGIHIQSSTATLTNCAISGNSASFGGGLSLWSSAATLTNCTVSGNSASSYYDKAGGGLHAEAYSTATLTNCTITDNSSEQDGGGVSLRSSSTATLTHCTVSRNTASQYGNGLYANGSTATLKNTILWGNGAQEWYNSNSTVLATYSDIYSPLLTFPGEGNINADPLFVDGVNGNYRLQASSPCIDAGDPTSPLDPDGTRADIGAIPFNQEGNLPPIWISVLDTTVVYDELLEFSVTAHDPNGDSLVYNAPILPTGAMFVDSTFRWTPVVGQVGDTVAVFSVTDGEFTVYDTVRITVTLSVSVSLSVPASFNLAQNAPNPFNPSTTIQFSLANDGLTSLSIYDVNGRLVRALVHGSLRSGEHSVVWDGTDTMGRQVASGVYLYRLSSHEGVVTRKMAVVR